MRCRNCLTSACWLSFISAYSPRRRSASLSGLSGLETCRINFPANSVRSGVRNLDCFLLGRLGRVPMDFLRVNIDVLLLDCVANHSLFCGDTRAWRGQPGQRESAPRASDTAGGGPEKRKVSETASPAPRQDQRTRNAMTRVRLSPGISRLTEKERVWPRRSDAMSPLA